MRVAHSIQLRLAAQHSTAGTLLFILSGQAATAGGPMNRPSPYDRGCRHGSAEILLMLASRRISPVTGQPQHGQACNTSQCR